MKSNKAKTFKNYVTIIIGILCLIVALVMLILKEDYIKAILFNQFAMLCYLMNKDDR